MSERPKREKVGRIIQAHFFPYPPTKWETMSEMQRDTFLECADEILEALKPVRKEPRP